MRKFLAAALFAAIPLPVSAQQLAPDTAAKVATLAQKVLADSGVPSASIGIVQDDRIVYTRAFGLARVSPPVPADASIAYPIGSISKQFTAAAILLLQEEGKLSLDDAVGKYVPGLTRGDEVTIRQILSHTSGYQDYWPEDYVMTPMLAPISANLYGSFFVD